MVRSSCSRSHGHSTRRRRVRSSRRPSASTISWRGTAGRLAPGPPWQRSGGYWPCVLVVDGWFGTAPGGVVDVVFFCFGAFLQSCVTKPLRQFVFFFHFLRKSLTKLSSAFCWFCDASSCLIVSLACEIDCCEAGVTFWTLKT